MALALYRKYRPQTFADLTDQVHVRVTLENQIASGKTAHAYLFSGPRGVGKTTTARLLAKAVNCTDRKGSEPCLACPSCQAIQENKAIDIVEIDAASHTGVDAVRENIIENVRFTPSQLKYKVFIIDEVHMLSTAAFNALLKTLEEPPPHALFVLATTETHKVPATIISRCQRFPFHKIPVPALVTRLAALAAKEEVDVDPAVLQQVARAAGGSLRDAESLLGQVLALGEKRITPDEAALVLPRSDIGLARELLAAVDRGQGGEALRLIDRLIADGVDLGRFSEDAVRLLRLGLLAAMGERAGLAELDESDAAFVGGPLAAWGTPRILAAIDVMLTCQERLKRGDGAALPLEIAAATLVSDDAAPQAVVPARLPAPAPAEPASGPKAHAPEDSFVAPAPPVAPPVPAPDPATLTTALETFKAKWKELIAAAGERNHSLPYALTGSVPHAVEGGTLVVGVPFAFHRDRVNDLKNKHVIEACCEQVFGERVSIDALVVEGLHDPKSDVTPVSMDDPVIKNVLDAFGGRIVA